MLSRVRTAAIAGVQAVPVEVEADVGAGLPCFTIVGLGDTAVQEARERVRAAIRAAGYSFPVARVLVNLAPAPMRKHGTGFDLPIAAAVLLATGQLDREALGDATLVGELALDGRVRATKALLVHAVMAARFGTRLIGPSRGSEPARSVLGEGYVGLDSLEELEGGPSTGPLRHTTAEAPSTPVAVDMDSIAGQAHARRALEIAAAGRHHLLLEGPPGAGKTLLARALPGILPPLDDDERLATALIHSVAGLDESLPLAGRRPFRAPHHASTKAGIVGGGSPVRPGEACLAHNGVLFLDEMNEFAPSVLQTLRQPLEAGVVRLVRADGVVSFPASFSLVGALNPCPCGYLGDGSGRCRCPPAVLERYRTRIGGPLRDRIDLQVRVGAVAPAEMLASDPAEPSMDIATRVLAARSFAATGRRPVVRASAAGGLASAFALDSSAASALERCGVTGGLSGRGLARTARVARTVADLDASETVKADHVLEAYSFRGDGS